MLFQHLEEAALAVEDLHAVGLAVGDVDALVLVDGHVMGPDELARVDAGTAPGADVVAFGGVAVHIRVAVPVRDEEIAADGRDGRVRRTVERLAAPDRRRVAADRELQIALGRPLRDRVRPVIDAPDGVIGTDEHAVGASVEHPLAEAAQEPSAQVEHHHGVVRVAREEEHLVPRVDRYTGRLLQGHAARELLPVLDDFVAEGAFTQNHRHRCAPRACHPAD